MIFSGTSIRRSPEASHDEYRALPGPRVALGRSSAVPGAAGPGVHAPGCGDECAADGLPAGADGRRADLAGAGDAAAAAHRVLPRLRGVHGAHRVRVLSAVRGRPRTVPALPVPAR